MIFEIRARAFRNFGENFDRIWMLMSRRVGVGADLSFSVRLEGGRALNFVPSSSEGAINRTAQFFLRS